jgi:hypothetical protein
VRGATASVTDTADVPLFAIVSVRPIGSDAADAISPNEIVAGAAVNVAFTASPMFNRPAPTDRTLACNPRSVTSWLAVLTTADLICAGERGSSASPAPPRPRRSPCIARPATLVLGRVIRIAAD